MYINYLYRMRLETSRLTSFRYIEIIKWNGRWTPGDGSSQTGRRLGCSWIKSSRSYFVSKNGISGCQKMVGGFKHGIFEKRTMSYMDGIIGIMKNPSHWRSPSFFKMGTLHHQAAIVFPSKVWSNPGETVQKSRYFGSWNGPQATA